MSLPFYFQIFEFLHWIPTLLVLGFALRYRHLTHWCYLLAAAGFLELCLRSANALITLLGGERDFIFWLTSQVSVSNDLANILRMTIWFAVNLLKAVALGGILMDFKRQVAFLRQASRRGVPAPPESIDPSNSPIFD